MQTIADFQGKSQNLAFTRFLVAILVIFSHAYPVLGLGTDPLWAYSREQITCGGVAVSVFLFSSGFFVTGSLIRNNGKHFLRNRAARLYPAFATVILSSMLILGPAVSTLTAEAYFSHPGSWRYLLFLVLIPQYQLPGVFEGHALTNVNGSLWTMTLETLCYSGLFVAWKLKLLRKEWAHFLAGGYVVTALIVFGLQPAFMAPVTDYLRPIFLFAAGILFYVFQDRIALRRFIGAGCCLAFVALFALGLGNLAMTCFFPYILCCMIFAERQVPANLSRLGDYSYAMYLIAFPIQQIWVSWLPDAGIALHTLLSAFSTLVLSLPLYYLVEKPAGKRLTGMKK